MGMAPLFPVMLPLRHGHVRVMVPWVSDFA
jgi:hypothetical protein